MPTAIASDSARQRWTNLRLFLLEIQGESPGAVEVWPSSDIASFSVTSGSPVRACLRNGWLSNRAAVASSPAANSTSTPPSRRIPGPRPAAFSLGSSEAITTREIPASRDRLRTGRLPTRMSTGLQRHVHRRSGRVIPSAPTVSKSRPLSMKLPQLSVEPLTHHLVPTHHNSSDKRIRTDPPAPALGKLASPPQMGFIRACQLRFHRTD